MTWLSKSGSMSKSTFAVILGSNAHPAEIFHGTFETIRGFPTLS
jgi:hypothetical protein